MDTNQKNELEKKNRKKLVEAFQAEIANNNRIVQFLEAFPYMLEIFAPDGTAVFINYKFCEAYNLARPEEFIGDYNIFEDTYVLNHLNIRSVIERIFKGEAVVINNFRTPFEEWRKDYSYTLKKDVINEFQVHEITSFPILDEQGKIAYIIVTSQVTGKYKGKKEIIEAQEYINKNWLQKFNLCEVAARVNLSSYYFSRLFKQNTGKSPYEYYKNVKINKLKQELKNENISVAKAFGECGLTYKGKYEKYFKDIVGMTPSEYKKTHGKR